MPEKRKYDSTVARIAGNIAGRLIPDHVYDANEVATEAVALARAIVAEVERTEPVAAGDGYFGALNGLK